MPARPWLAGILLLPLLAGCLTAEEPAATAMTGPPTDLPGILIRWTPSGPQAGDPVFFDVESSNATDPITGADWDFGDGLSAKGVSPVHTYAGRGTYAITITVRTASGAEGPVGTEIQVGGDPGPASDAPEEPSAGNGTSGSQGNGTQGQQARPFEAEDPQQDCGSLGSLEPVLPTAMDPTGAVLGWQPLRLDVVLLADPTFVEANPNNWTELLEALVSDASAHYEEQFDLLLKPLLIEALPPGSLAPGSGDGRQRAVARGYMHANHPDLDFDYVAVVLGADYEGTVAGQVECVHGALNKENAYLWMEYDEPRNGTSEVLSIGSGGEPILALFQDTPLKVFMHESAHLFAAHHHYTQCGTTMTGYDILDAAAVCGNMINDIGLASYTFSQTNRLVVRSFVEELGIGEPV